MKKIALRWIVLAFSVFGASLLCQALKLGFQVDVFDANNGIVFGKVITLLLGVAVLSFLNATLGGLLKLITFPLSCLTLGFFSLIVNAAVFYLAASFKLGFMITSPGFQGFLSAFVASIFVSFINGVLGVFLPDGKDD